MLVTIIGSIFVQNSQDWRKFLSLENFRTGNTSIIYYGCQYIIGTSYFEKPTGCGKAIRL